MYPIIVLPDFLGESATGKSWFVIAVAAEFLRQNPTGILLYYDTEAAVSKNLFAERGMDTKRIIVSGQDTLENFRNHCTNVLAEYEKDKVKDRVPFMIVLDSLGMLSSNKELEDSLANKNVRDMTKAQLVRGIFRTLTLKLAQLKVPFLITNHVYAGIGQGNLNYTPVVESGGGGYKYAPSVSVGLSKAIDRDQTTKLITGNIITAKILKSRLSKENTSIKMKLDYAKGLDRYYGLLEIAEKYGIVEQVAKKWKFPDQEAQFEKRIYKNPEKYFTSDILSKIDEVCKKEFSYGGSEIDDEEMDDVEVYEA